MRKTVIAGEAPARSIVARLRSAGHRAYLVGGCVRDLLLERAPQDYDVATSATPDEILAQYPEGNRVGAHFGVVLVGEVEVATFRSDRGYADHRRPDSVRFETDPRQDALRRDFTINALMMDPESGEVLDFTGGRDDLDRRMIRTVGEPGRRFAEDHLRLLRAVRFAARLGFTIEEATLAAIREMAGQIRTV